VTATCTPALAALDRASQPGGASALDEAVSVDHWRRALIGPAESFLARPGKRLRTMIVEAGWALGGAEAAQMPEQLALIVELLHAGSLIIDDVEDDSVRRRGAPALHHVVGVPLAINTGTWMYFWALAEIAQLGMHPAAELAIHRAAASALVRCHQGQALDLATPITELAVQEVGAVVEAATRLKTGELCKLAAQLGAVASGASTPVSEAAARFGTSVGVALQMLDDLGALASPRRREKGREDLCSARPTWPWAWLAQHDAFAWSRCIARARTLGGGTDVADADALADALVVEIGMLGRHQIHATITHALHELRGAVGDNATTRQLALELARMEASYE
jgi:geranylgeranyl pyrophosphate synthase